MSKKKTKCDQLNFNDHFIIEGDPKSFLIVDWKIAFQENDFQMQKQENGINFYIYKEQQFPSVTTILKQHYQYIKQYYEQSNLMERGIRIHQYIENYLKSSETYIACQLKNDKELFDKFKPILDKRFRKLY